MQIKLKIKECRNCHKEKPIYYVTGQLCQFCNNLRLYKKQKDRYLNDDGPLSYTRLKTLYKKYWDDNTDRRCYECGCPLHNFKNWHINHIIPKRLWKQYLPADIVYDYKYIVYVCLSCHHEYDHGNKENTHKMLEKFNELNIV